MLKSKSLLSSLISITLLSLLTLSMLATSVNAVTFDLTVRAKVVTPTGETYVNVKFSFVREATTTIYTTPYTITVDNDVHYLLDLAVNIIHDGKSYRLSKVAVFSGSLSTTLLRGELMSRPADWDEYYDARLVYDIIGDAGNTVIDAVYERAGPKIDVFRGKVIKSPDAALIAMQIGQADVSTGLIRTGDVEKLAADGHTVTYDAGFHMGHIGLNLRPLEEQHHADGSPRRTDTTIWPLAEVVFRHAVFHCYDQEAIVASIYGYTVTPVQSLVPPAQGGWVNPSVPKHPYNPGNPITSPSTEHSSSGILKAAGYVFVDAGTTGVVDAADYWTKGVGGPKVPMFTLWSPTYEAAPTSAEHASRFIADLGEIGLGDTLENGHSGFRHEPAEFANYMDQVDAAEFDAYMVFWSLGRFPDHLYDMAHSSQICGPEPENKGKYNKPGINDPDIDAATYAIKTSLDHAAKLQAAYDAQEYLYDETRPNAMGYLQLYSRIYFDGFNVDLLGVVKSPGYGADNGWTDVNIHWAPGSAGEAAHTNPDGTHVINWIEGEVPERLNPNYASTVYAWDVMEKTLDGLLDVDPYTHEDLTSMSSAMPTIVQVEDHMEITFYIRKDIFWQDGTPYKAQDAKFNWDFFKNNAVPRYTTTWMYIDHVDIIDDYTVKVTTNMTSQFLVYDIAGLAAYLPPNVWGPLDGTGLPNILAYDPSTDTDSTGMGPWFGTDYGASTRLFGTGPFLFDYWDPVGQVWEVHQFPGYFETTVGMQDQKATMFHEVGDVNWDGEVWADDRGTMGSKYGKFWFMPEYLADADVNLDGVIDVIDLSLANFHFGELREYPTP